MPALALLALLAGGLAPGTGAAAAAKAAGTTARPAAKPSARPAGRAASTAAAPGDTILARLPFATISRNEFLRAWAGVSPQYRPPGTGMTAKRAFLDQMIQKDLLANAATSEPFTMAPLESAQFNAELQNYRRAALFRRLVRDSARVVAADLDSVRARLGPDQAKGLPRAQLEAAAHQFAERRRAGEVDARVRAGIAAAYDDSVAALLVRAYAQLDQKPADASQPFQVKLPMRQPPLSPADSGRVLVRSSLGELTALAFTQRFLRFDPFKTSLPASIDDVHRFGDQILGQIWFDNACLDPAVQGDPEVISAARERRESIALDHYYAAHITARVDTSEALLRARYARSPEDYAAPAHWTVTRMPFPTQAAADSAQAALAHGTAWDSLCAHAYPDDGGRRGDCGNEIQLPDPYPDTVFTIVLTGLKPGEASVLPIPSSAPDDERRLLVRLVGHTDRKFQSFEEARGYVLRDVQSEQSESILNAEIARLRAAARVTTNERALARVDLAGWARRLGQGATGAAGTGPPGAAPSGPPEER